LVKIGDFLILQNGPFIATPFSTVRSLDRVFLLAY